jgi:amino acid adenylation domain-containing protein
MYEQETNAETAGFRLSPQQQRSLGADGVAAVAQFAVPLPQQADAASLTAALAPLIARHEILRTTFPRAEGMRGRTQVILDALAVECRGGSGAELAPTLAAEAAGAFDLDHGPLLRALATPTHLVLTAHAATADAASLQRLAGELLAPAGETDEPIQYADYAEWRHELLSGDDQDSVDGRAFWSGAADPAGAPRILAASGERRSGRLGALAISADASLIARAASDAGVSSDVWLEACWHALVARVAGRGEVLIAGGCDGRAQPDLEHAVGPYAQPVPIRSRAEADTSFAEIVDQVNRARATATRWQDFGTAEDLAALVAGAAAGFVPYPASDADLTALRPAPSTDLILGCSGASAVLWFDTGAVADADAARLAEMLCALIASAAADSSQPIAQLALADGPTRERLVAAAAGPAPEPDADTPVHRLFTARAARHPDRPAVRAGAAVLTYAQLDAAANRIAHRAIAAGAGRGAAVGLCMERTPSLLAAVIGIHKAGAAYVPLNFEHPPARLAHQLTESGAKLLITEQHLLEKLPEVGIDVLCTDRDQAQLDALPDTDPGVETAPADLAYVMYTSGTTGLPKGVAVTHGNLANYSTHLARRLDADTAPLRFGVVSAISTDLGNTCIFPALVSGGCVQLITPDAAVDGALMAAELGDHRLDVLKITPSHLRGLLAGGRGADVLPAGTLVLGGEALSWDLVATVRGLSTAKIVNHYGPTETTIGCCAYDVAEPRTDSATVPIGGPLAGARAYVLDRALQPVPEGVSGELCIAGAGVAAGYVGGTAANGDGPFVADPFNSSERMYRTGDRARRLADGAIEFLGRVDDQVKIHGFRIEPAEIETLLLRHPAVRQAAVLAEPDARGEAHLVAYIATSADPSLEELRAYLAQSLPDYMIPSAFATLETLPFTPSGKIDRRALAAQDAGEMRHESEFVAPRDELERQIAGIWAELLGTDEVGVFDDFFALGGHSLLATQAIMRIRREHGNIPLRALLAAPTVAELAEVVRSAGTTGESVP